MGESNIKTFFTTLLVFFLCKNESLELFKYPYQILIILRILSFFFFFHYRPILFVSRAWEPKSVKKTFGDHKNIPNNYDLKPEFQGLILCLQNHFDFPQLVLVDRDISYQIISLISEKQNICNPIFFLFYSGSHILSFHQTGRKRVKNNVPTATRRSF